MYDGKLFFSKRNEKLSKTEKAWEARFKKKARFVSFNLPQHKSETGQMTCPYAGDCVDFCYAGQGRYAMYMAKATREHNLELVNDLSASDFAQIAAESIDSMESVTHVRIHDSGDFFSRDYYESWVAVARMIPHKTFYAYTKSIPFLNWESHSKNFRITQSAGGKRDKDIDTSRPHSRVFATDEERRKHGYVDGNASDIPAILGYTKIGLVYHGTKNLSDKSLVKLRRKPKFHLAL